MEVLHEVQSSTMVPEIPEDLRKDMEILSASWRRVSWVGASRCPHKTSCKGRNRRGSGFGGRFAFGR